MTGHSPPEHPGEPRTLEELTEPVVVVIDGARFALRGPLSQLIAFVVQHAPLCHAAAYSTWVFDVSRGNVKAKVELRWETLSGTAKG